MKKYYFCRNFRQSVPVMKRVLENIRACYPRISEESLIRLEKCVERRLFPPRHVMVREGAFAGFAYFIEKGITRSYWMVDGEEVTTSFAAEGSIVFSMDELYYGKKSEEYVETIEAVEAYAIPVPVLRRLFETDLGLANWGRIIHQDEYRRLHRSHKERLSCNAVERYECFRRQFPEVCLRVRLGDIASYLGITSSTLSRLRARK